MSRLHNAGHNQTIKLGSKSSENMEKLEHLGTT